MFHKTKAITNIIQAMAAIKGERIIKQFATMDTPPLQYSRGYSKAMECIEMMALEAVNNGFGDIGSQDYKWANIVIDKETGNVMDLEKLLKHPKYIKTWTRAASNEFGKLFQGYGTTADGTKRVEGTNTCHCIRKDQVPKGKIATYNCSVANVMSEKKKRPAQSSAIYCRRKHIET